MKKNNVKPLAKKTRALLNVGTFLNLRVQDGCGFYVVPTNTRSDDGFELWSGFEFIDLEVILSIPRHTTDMDVEVDVSNAVLRTRKERSTAASPNPVEIKESDRAASKKLCNNQEKYALFFAVVRACLGAFTVRKEGSGIEVTLPTQTWTWPCLRQLATLPFRFVFDFERKCLRCTDL